MHPNPMADTSKSLSPNLRFCMDTPFWFGSACFLAGRKPVEFPRCQSGTAHGLCAILLVGYLLQPIDCFPVELFLNREVSHGGGWRCPMPMLFAWREPDHIP